MTCLLVRTGGRDLYNCGTGPFFNSERVNIFYLIFARVPLAGKAVWYSCVYTST